MAIREDLEARLRQARRERDEETKNVIAMLKSKLIVELKSGKGREEGDELWREVIGAYAKQLSKSMAEFVKAGERGEEGLAEARRELAFCEQFLPKKLDEAQTEALVREVADSNGITDAKMMGKLMGILMKEHRDQVDGALARSIAQRILAGG